MRRLQVCHGGAVGLEDAEAVDELAEELAVFRGLDAGRWRPDDVDPVLLQVLGQVQGRLAAELHDHAFAFFAAVNVQDVLEGERFEVQPVAGVVVGTDRLRIAVDHDGFEPRVAQGEGGVDAAVVELDALADAVGTAAQDHDLASGRRPALVNVAVGRVIVGCVRFELCRTGVHQRVHGQDPEFFALSSHLVFGALQKVGDLAVRVPELLDLAQQGQVLAEFLQAARGADLVFERGEFLHLVEEPAVDTAQLVDLVDGPATPEGFANLEDALGIRPLQFRGQRGVAEFLEAGILGVGAEAAASYL